MDLVGLMRLDEMLVESARKKYSVASNSYASLVNFRKEINVACGRDETCSNIPNESNSEEYEKLLTEGYEALGLIMMDMIKVCKEYNCYDTQKQVLVALALHRRKTMEKKP